MARSRISWGPSAWEGNGRIKKETESESGIMKQFIIDLITVKSHSNHLRANRVILSILLGKKGALKMLKSGKDEDGFVTKQIRSAYLFIYFPSWPPITHVQNESPLETLVIFQVQFRHLKHHGN